MRLRSLLPIALIVLAAACKSASESTETTTEHQEPMNEAAAADLTEDPSNGELHHEGEPLEAAAPAPDPTQQADDLMSDEQARISVTRQRQEFLAAEYVRQGDSRLEQADLQGALESYATALEVMPSNQDARAKLRRVQALVGDATASGLVDADELRQSEVVRRQQARLAAEQSTDAGDQSVRQGDFESALAHYRQALVILQYHPLIADGSLDEQILLSKVQAAEERLEETRVAEANRRATAARSAKKDEERRQREYRENKLRTIYQEANAAFLNENFARAEALASQILLSDPGNTAASRMREVAQDARHDKRDQTIRRDYREQWIRTFEELDTLDVPQTDSVVYDLERWRVVDQRQPLEFKDTDPLGTADRRAVEERLELARIAPNFIGPDGEGAPLEEVAAYLQNVTGVNFLISTLVREDLDEEETTIKLQLPERNVRKVLDIISETSDSLRWKIEDGVVKFVTAEELTGGQVLRMYEVRDIIHPIPDFPGRDINLLTSNGPVEFDEDIEEREGLVVTADQLDALIRDNIAPESWDLDPNNSLRITESGTLVVNQTPDVQDMVQDLLDDLRESTGIMVDIQTRFLNVEDNFLEDIGVDFRGLGQPGLGTNLFFDDFGDATTQLELGREIGTGRDLGFFYDEGGDGDIRGRIQNLYDLQLGDTDVITGAGGLSFQWTFLNDLQMELILRAVSKSERVELVTAPRLLVFNSARANVTVVNQIAYVADFDVEIAQAASIADPIIGVAQDGVILDVRPVVSADRRFILMEMRPTVATLERPIREVATSLGTGPSVTIQLPDLDIQRVRTTVPMPDGGTVMLGGLKVSEKKDLRSGVPILNKIPILSFLFERKGNFVSNRKLLVLLRAQIVIPDELAPTTSQLGM